jgi:hypothetical protein
MDILHNLSGEIYGSYPTLRKLPQVWKDIVDTGMMDSVDTMHKPSPYDPFIAAHS